MEPRKMVLMFARQQRRNRKQTYGQGWGEKGQGEMNGESSMNAYTLIHVNRQPTGFC